MVNVMKYANDGIRRSIAISIFFPEVMFLSLLAIQLRARSLHRNTVAEGKIQDFCLGKISTMIRLLSQCCFFFLCYPVFEPLQIRIYLVFRKEKEYIFVQHRERIFQAVVHFFNSLALPLSAKLAASSQSLQSPEPCHTVAQLDIWRETYDIQRARKIGGGEKQ